jgi:hypothetical protein
MPTSRIRNVGQLISTIVSVYYLAKYKYFALIFSFKCQILYLADFINTHRPFGLAQTPYVFYIVLCDVLFIILSLQSHLAGLQSYHHYLELL